MAVKKMQVQDSTGNIYHPETEVAVVLSNGVSIDGMLNKTLTHTKTGTIHALTGTIPTTGLIVATFKAASEFAEGDSFTINGEAYMAKPNGEELILPNKSFIVGDLVNVTVDISGKKLGFKLGGGGDKPRITVSLTAPTEPVEGDFWVVDSGYELDTLIADAVQPETLEKDTLFLLTSTSSKVFQILKKRKYDIKTYVRYAQVFNNNSWKLSTVKVYSNGSWTDISVGGNKLFKSNDMNVYEVDPYTFSEIKNFNEYVAVSDIGGIKNRLYFVSYNARKIYEIDSSTGIKLKEITVDKYPNGIGGIESRLFTSYGGGVSIIEIDPNTFVKIRSFKYGYNKSVGGIKNKLFNVESNDTAEVYTINEFNVETLSVIRSKTAKNDRFSIDGIQDNLFVTGRHLSSSSAIYELDINTLTEISEFITGTQNQFFGIGGTK